jgi:thiaminase
MKMIEGKPMSAQEAKKIVDGLYEKMHARWKEKVTQSPFMRKLQDGTLPMEAIRLY